VNRINSSSVWKLTKCSKHSNTQTEREREGEKEREREKERKRERIESYERSKFIL
jgi:hypothetical protein